MAMVFFSFLLFFGGGFCVIAWLICREGMRRQSSFLTYLGGVPLGVCGFVAFITLIGFAESWIFPTSPAERYESIFNQRPGADVKELQYYDYAFGDHAATYLRFKANPKTIQTLTKNGWKEVAHNHNDRPDKMGYETEPDWWQPIDSKTTRVFIPTEKSTGFANIMEALSYDPKTRQAFYYISGID